MAINSVISSPPVFHPFTKREGSVIAETQLQERTKQKPAEAKNDNQSGLQQELSKEEQQQVEELAARDREVKTHEAAHKAAGGGLTGPAQFSYTTGPDGKRYATGGEVSIDTSEVPGDPQATLIKANRIHAAALAPAEPSGQDRKVAAQASQMAADARAEMAKQKRDGNESGDGEMSNTHAQFHRQPLYDNSAAVSSTNSTGNVLDYMV
ncbi:putative metalloprotease CJM1_0395 family protein [Kaarinaea lacus]